VRNGYFTQLSQWVPPAKLRVKQMLSVPVLMSVRVGLDEQFASLSAPAPVR